MISLLDSQNVGGGLPPMRECHLKYLCLTNRHRGQAPSHIWISCLFERVFQIQPSQLQ